MELPPATLLMLAPQYSTFTQLFSLLWPHAKNTSYCSQMFSLPHLDVLRQKVLVNDSSLLQEVHNVCQLVRILQHFVRCEARLGEGRGDGTEERREERRGKGGGTRKGKVEGN